MSWEKSTEEGWVKLNPTSSQKSWESWKHTESVLKKNHRGKSYVFPRSQSETQAGGMRDTEGLCQTPDLKAGCTSCLLSLVNPHLLKLSFSHHYSLELLENWNSSSAMAGEAHTPPLGRWCCLGFTHDRGIAGTGRGSPASEIYLVINHQKNIKNLMISFEILIHWQ